MRFKAIKDRKQAKWRFAVLGCVIAIMVMIFAFSAQNGEASNAVSDGVLQRVGAWIKPIVELFISRAITYDELMHIIRKLGHFSEYLLLASFGLLFAKLSRWKHAALFTFVFAVSYAATDELHQMFVEARSASIIDVGIDATGAIAGIILTTFVWLISSLINTHIRKER